MATSISVQGGVNVKINGQDIDDDLELKALSFGLTLPYSFRQGCAVVYHDKIHILGNTDTSNISNLHRAFDGINWEELRLPYACKRASAVVYNDEIHLLGTENSGKEKYHYKWNEDDNTWTSVSTLPYNFYLGGAVVYNNELHILGGGESTTRKYHYKWSGSSWTSVSTLPYDFYGGFCAIYNNDIHLFVSYNEYTRHYKWNGTEWAFVSKLPDGYYYSNGAGCVINNEVWLIGSDKSSNDSDQRAYVWNGEKWKFAFTPPVKTTDSQAVTFQNKIWLLGGYQAEYSMVKIDPNIRSDYDEIWEYISEMPLSKKTSTVIYNGEVHCIGSGTSPYTQHYKWDGTSWTSVSTLPVRAGEGTQPVVVYDGCIHIFGDISPYTQHYKWDGTSWTSVSTLPYGSPQRNAVIHDNEIHLLSGSQSQTSHYKWDGTSWTSVSTLPFTYNSPAGYADYNGEIHMMGGSNYSAYNCGSHYKWTGTAWVSVATINKSFYGCCSLVNNGYLYTLCGDYTNCIMRWDGNEWNVVSGLGFKNSNKRGAIFYNNELIIFGMISTSEMYVAKCKNLNRRPTTIIKPISQMKVPNPRPDGAAVKFMNEIHTLGAYYEGSSSVTAHRKFNGNMTEVVSTLPYEFCQGEAVEYDNCLHILGGGKSGTETNHYKWNGTSWEVASTLPYSFVLGCAVVYNDELHILGGSSSNSTKTYHYKWNGTSWTSVSRLPYNFNGGGAVVYNNELHILGSKESVCGYNHFKYTGSTWKKLDNIPTWNYQDTTYVSGIAVFHNKICMYYTNQRCVTWDGQKYGHSMRAENTGVLGAIDLGDELYTFAGGYDEYYENPDTKQPSFDITEFKMVKVN